MAAEVGGRGDGIIGVGVAIDVVFGVEPEYGLPAPGVAIVLEAGPLYPSIRPLGFSSGPTSRSCCSLCTKAERSSQDPHWTVIACC
jgi:hypothetical protein